MNTTTIAAAGNRYYRWEGAFGTWMPIKKAKALDLIAFGGGVLHECDDCYVELCPTARHAAKVAA